MSENAKGFMGWVVILIIFGGAGFGGLHGESMEKCNAQDGSQ